jgi:hypothetical protein
MSSWKHPTKIIHQCCWQRNSHLCYEFDYKCMLIWWKELLGIRWIFHCLPWAPGDDFFSLLIAEVLNSVEEPRSMNLEYLENTFRINIRGVLQWNSILLEYRVLCILKLLS